MTRRCSGCGEDFEPQRHYHRRCWPCWREHEPPPRSQSYAPPRVVPVLDSATIRAAVALTHPDRHPVERHDAATRVTQALTGALATVRGMER